MKREASGRIRGDEQGATRAVESPALAPLRPGRTLAALTSSALALPGITSPARADAPIERATGTAAFSYYFEDSLSPSKFDDSTGSRDRYEVYTGQFRFDMPVSERVDVGLDFLYEEMSGASPWFVTADPTRGLLQVMSGATIEDTRVDGTIDFDFYMDSGKDTVSFGFSNEKDYLSLHGGLGTERNFNDKNTTLNLSIAFAHDELEPTDAEIFTNRPEEESKWSLDLFAGLSQILTRSSTMQFTINYKHSDGYLSDPYKEISQIGGPNLPDLRPETKDQASFLLRYRHHIEPIDASAHVDYRFYVDDWGLVSHTFEAAWYQRCLEWLTIAPTIRYYSQSKTDFYEPVLPPGVVVARRSSDYRLSPYGAVSARIKFEAELIDAFQYDPPAFLQAIGISDGFDLIASISYERYLSDGAFGITAVGDDDEAPGLVNFQVVAFTLSGRF